MVESLSPPPAQISCITSEGIGIPQDTNGCFTQELQGYQLSGFPDACPGGETYVTITDRNSNLVSLPDVCYSPTPQLQIPAHNPGYLQIGVPGKPNEDRLFAAQLDNPSSVLVPSEVPLSATPIPAEMGESSQTAPQVSTDTAQPVFEYQPSPTESSGTGQGCWSFIMIPGVMGIGPLLRRYARSRNK